MCTGKWTWTLEGSQLKSLPIRLVSNGKNRKCFSHRKTFTFIFQPQESVHGATLPCCYQILRQNFLNPINQLPKPKMKVDLSQVHQSCCLFHLHKCQVASVQIREAFVPLQVYMEKQKRWKERQKYPNIWIGMELTDGNHLSSRKANWERERCLNQIWGCGVKLCHNFWILIS